jgi:hypothetical protein
MYALVIAPLEKITISFADKILTRLLRSQRRNTRMPMKVFA